MNKKVSFLIISIIIFSLPVLFLYSVTLSKITLNIASAQDVCGGCLSGQTCDTENALCVDNGPVDNGNSYVAGDGCRSSGTQDCPAGQTCNQYMCAYIVNTVDTGNTNTGGCTLNSQCPGGYCDVVGIAGPANTCESVGVRCQSSGIQDCANGQTCFNNNCVSDATGARCRTSNFSDCATGQHCVNYSCVGNTNGTGVTNTGTTGSTTSGGKITVKSIVDAAEQTTLYIASGIVVILWVITGLLFLTAQGAPDKVTKARQALIASVAGTVLVIVAASAIAIISSAFGI